RQRLDERGPQARRVVGLAEEVVVGHAAELVMRARRDVDAISELATLELDVALLLALGHRGQERGEAVAGGVLAAEGDEDEPEAEVAQLRERQRVGIHEPLERR